MTDGSAPTPEEQKKEEWLTLHSGAKARAPKLEALGRGIVQYARLFGDTAGPLHQTYEAVPACQLTLEEWEARINSLRTWTDIANDLDASRARFDAFAAATNTVISSASGVFSPSPFTGVTAAPPSDPVFAAPRSKFFQVLQQFPLTEQARQSMIRLGLTSRTGKSRPPSDLLEEACGAMRTPVVPDGRPNSALLPLRACIDASITELIRRRSPQERTDGWKEKVTSLGRHCSRPGLAADHYDRLGEDTDRLMNELSGAKKDNHTRDQVHTIFYRGLMHLNGLLDSIDEGKLRPA